MSVFMRQLENCNLLLPTMTSPDHQLAAGSGRDRVSQSISCAKPACRMEPLVFTGVRESSEAGFLTLSPEQGAVKRRVLYVNSYGGQKVWDRIKDGRLPAHHLWGCLELVRMGYAVAMAEPLRNFYWHQRPLPHDLRLLKAVRGWLRTDDIVYCGHTLLYWLPLLKQVGLLNRRLVSMCYAREELDLRRAHSGVIALTPAAMEESRKRAPRVPVAHLGWGADLRDFSPREYAPQWFLACGITNRDFRTLSRAAAQCQRPVQVICPGLPPGVDWPANVTVIDGGPGWNFQKEVVSHRDLVDHYYPGCVASLIIMQPDPTEYTANGFTNLIEALALARPVIVTRTGALPGELDVEKAGCGLFVPPGDPEALAKAMNELAADPARARAMGERGRQLAEQHYNIDRYAQGLHAHFESL